MKKGAKIMSDDADSVTMDRRQAKTRKAVFEAFTELIEEKGYAGITIQDIIERADIGRSTFYSHFDTKEDLLRVLCEEIFDHVFSKGLGKEKDHDFSGVHDLKDELTHILYHLDDNRRTIRSVISAECGNVFMEYFKRYLEKMFADQITEYPEGVPKGYVIDHYVSGYAETVRWWMDNGDYSPEEVMDFFWRFIR